MNYTVRNLIIATVLAVIAMLLTVSYIGSQRAQIEKGQHKVRVLVASKDIPAGTSFEQLKEGGFLSSKEVLSSTVEHMQTVSEWTPEDSDRYEKQSVAETVYTDEVLDISRHLDPVGDLPASDRIAGTERWISVPVSNVQAVAGHIRAGDRVDIFAAGAPEPGSGGAGRPAAWIAARNVLIVETPQSRARAMAAKEGKAADEFQDGPTSENGSAKGDASLYVLQVSDAVAAHLVLAMQIGNSLDGTKSNLYLSLRPASGATQTKLSYLDKISASQ